MTTPVKLLKGLQKLAKRTKPVRTLKDAVTPIVEADLATEVNDTPLTPQTANLDGRGKYKRQLEKFMTLDDDTKHRTLKDTWKEVAMVAASRARQFAATCSPKDFGRLYQLIMSGAVSIDKAFPKTEHVNSPSLVVNMFGSLGQRAARIAIPPTPETITVTAMEVPTTCPSTPSTTTVTSTTLTEEPLTIKQPNEMLSTDTTKKSNG